VINFKLFSECILNKKKNLLVVVDVVVGAVDVLTKIIKMIFNYSLISLVFYLLLVESLMHFSFILMLQFGLESHNGLILLGNITLIGLSFKHTFSNCP
jgi:hypothetical protein